MNKNKCVKKQKLSKKNKNKNKNKHKTNKFLYKIHGGSNISATTTLNTQKNNATPLTLQTLIQNPKVASVIIMFNGLKIKCNIGNNKFSTRDEDCIAVSYDFKKKVSKSEGFFFSKPKTYCIGSNNNYNINNKEYKKLHKEQNIKDTYNKSLNKLLLTLIDIINIDLQMTHCVVTDASFITCINEIKISLDIKHYARGYGFYNEFGYIYFNNVNTDTLTDTLEKKINYANIILKSIHVLSHKTISELELELNALRYIVDTDIVLYNFESSKTKLLKLCEILNIINEPPQTVRQLLNEIFKLICNSTDSETIENIKEVINDKIDYLNLFIKQMFVLQRLIYKNNPHHFKFHKYYDTTNKEGRIYTSELNIPSDENPVPSFEMKEFIQPKINIISGSDDVEYIIDIK